jgi:hypothetical protein
VRATSENECPAPAARTSRPASAARPTASETSATLEGRSSAAGSQDSSRDQLRHIPQPTLPAQSREPS